MRYIYIYIYICMYIYMHIHHTSIVQIRWPVSTFCKRISCTCIVLAVTAADCVEGSCLSTLVSF